MAMVAERSGSNDVMTFGDGQAAWVLDGVGDGQGGEHDGQVRFDGIGVRWNVGRARRSLSDIRNQRSTNQGS